MCYEAGIEVTSLPGPAACITALTLSGLSTRRFCFEGFLTMNKIGRRTHLQELKTEKRTMIFYEAPHKLQNTLCDMLKYFGNREIALCRELTKIHENVEHTTLFSARDKYSEVAPKGEFVVIIEGKPEEEEKEMTELQKKILDPIVSREEQ